MKIIFVNDSKERVDMVYSPEIKNMISAEDIKVFSKKTILNNKPLFKDTEYIFSTWGMQSFTEDEIKEIFPSLKCVFYAAGSVQVFARPFINCGIKVFSAWAANAVPVAEYTVAQIILANKGFFRCSNINSISGYDEAKEIFSGCIGNYGAKIGIIGAGMIGALVIKMLKNYKLDVLVYDPFLPDEKAAELGVEKTTLERIFSECNVVSNHLANNEQTKGMLNGKLFEKMLQGSVFINTGRGAQVVESQLCEVLKSRSDITALLDVTDPEPPLPESPFYSLPNCILTPHMAGSMGNEVHRMAEYMAEEYDKYCSGEECRYEVTAKMLETMA